MQENIAKKKTMVSDLMKQMYRKITVKHIDRKGAHSFWQHPTEDNLPTTYAEANIERSEFLFRIMKDLIKPKCSILEIGCNAGRNLNYLHKNGFKNLSGIEINANAIELMKKVYPDLAKACTIHIKPVEDVVTKMIDNSIDLVFTMAVFEHIPREREFIFKEIARISKDYIVTIEEEEGTGILNFPRNYREIFTGFGFDEVNMIDLGRNSKEFGKVQTSFIARVFKKG